MKMGEGSVLVGLRTTLEGRMSATSETTAFADLEVSTNPHRGFAFGQWAETIDVRDFINRNFRPYTGDQSFLAGPTARTKNLWAKLCELFEVERERGVLGISQVPSSITAHEPGYIDKDAEVIVGLQTDAPLKRAIFPNGGWRMVVGSLKAYGLEPDPALSEVFTKYRKTHNDGVFDVYTPEIRRARSAHIITGLPDAYGRGRIIGDYRRIALYGVDRLIEEKKAEKAALQNEYSTESVIRDREELSEQIKALNELVEMGEAYGFDLSKPASNAKEAVQWLYFGYLAAVKEQNGAAMSLGRTSNFLDIYIERDLQEGTLTEEQAQEIIDDFVIKLRIVRFLRTPEYDALFSGDPTWVTESIGGVATDGRPLVTKNSFRFLNTLYNLGPAPEPNMTVLWNKDLPEGFKRFCAKVSIDTSSVQYESDDHLRTVGGDDTAIACCVSGMEVGKSMQFFGARVNLAKCLLYAINGGRDEISGDQIMPAFEPIQEDTLDYDEVLKRLDVALDWLSRVYVNALNCIHYMHDKYAYERIEMALHDYSPRRTMAFGIAGLSVVADSLSAIKNAKVECIRDDTGLITDYRVEGNFPAFGNNDDEVDEIAAWLVRTFIEKLRQHPTYRNAEHSLSVLTITSNVVYGKATGSTPDGRKSGEPFAPGANPVHGRDKSGYIASAMSVAKLPFEAARDGISLTNTVLPLALGSNEQDRIKNLASSLDGYFGCNGYHMNVNVLNRETLMDAMEHPENYPQLTVRVSGYAVNFVKLTKEQQHEVISRTFHESL